MILLVTAVSGESNELNFSGVRNGLGVQCMWVASAFTYRKSSPRSDAYHS